jgi:hypothetical protein
MKFIKTKLITGLYNSDLLSLKNTSNIGMFTQILISIKQLIKVIELNKKLPLFLICQNKQYSILMKNYIEINSQELIGIFFISYKQAVTLKVEAIYILLDCENVNLLSSKIQSQSNSILFLIERKYKNFKNSGEYFVDLNINSIKQVMFILTIIKKIKLINANIKKV